jgi:phosphoribosyl 1,2-cyclic phosphodiesterase
MQLKVVSSGSIGNCYILNGKDATLLIECGVKYQQILEQLDYDVFKVKACIVTHSHGDHAKSINQIMQNGIPIYASKGTFDKLKISKEQRYKEVEHLKGYNVNGGFKVMSFDVEHDAPQTMGYLINHAECGNVLFITDTYRLKWDFGIAFDHVVIETNFCEELVKDKSDSFINKRRYRAHMSFQTAMLTLQRMDLSNCKNIVLIHLSDTCSDENRFKQECIERFGIPTTIATKGQIINFSKEGF